MERPIACGPNRRFDDTITLLRYIAQEEIKQLQRVHTDLEIEIRQVELEETIRLFSRVPLGTLEESRAHRASALRPLP
jgi:hypothetical protein